MSSPAAAVSATPNRLHIGWGIGTLGASTLLNSFAALQLYYLTDVLGVAIATASLVLFAAKIWDWIANPLMGLISDRTHTRWGRRRPYLILGGAVSGFAFAVFFSSALTPVSQSLLLVTLSLALVGTGYTIFNVPYMAMPSELVDDYKERTRMISVRVFCIGIGTMIGISTQRLAEILGGDAQGYAQMGLIIGVFVFFFMALTFFGTAGGRQHARETQRVGLAEQLRTGFANKPFAALLGTKFTQLFGLFTSTAMSIFVVKYVLGKENPGEWMIYFTAVSFIGQTLSIPMWTWITNKIEKRAAYMLSTAAFCLMSLTWLVASPQESIYIFLLRALLKGLAAGGLLLLGQSMLPDTIEYDYRRTGLRREGVFSGLYSVVEKVASSFAPTLLGLGYAWFGFQSKAPVQTTEAIDGIRYCAAFLPCFYFGISLIPLWFYRLDEKTLKSAQRT